MFYRVSAKSVLMIVFLAVASNPQAFAQTKSTSGSNFDERNAAKEQFDIPINLWRRGFVSNFFSAKDILGDGTSVRVYQINGTFGGDQAKLIFNIFPRQANYKSSIEVRYKKFVKTFAPQYVNAGIRRLKVRGGAGRISKDAVAGCKYFVVGINSMRGTVFGDVCGDSITQMTNIFENFALSSKAENIASHNALNASRTSETISSVPKLFSDCSAAESSSEAKASFMQALESDDLVRYLDAGQSCSVFR